MVEMGIILFLLLCLSWFFAFSLKFLIGCVFGFCLCYWFCGFFNSSEDEK